MILSVDEVLIASVLEVTKRGPRYEYRGRSEDLFTEVVDLYPLLKGSKLAFDNAIGVLTRSNIASVHRHEGVSDYVVVKAEGSLEDVFKVAPTETSSSTDLGDIFDGLFKPKEWRYQIVGSYIEFGTEWLDEYISAHFPLSEDAGKSNLSPSSLAPAANRLVRLDDNQRSVFDEPTDEIVRLVEQNNSLSRDDGIRELIVGKLKAGRELLRAGVFTIESMHFTLVIGLKMLVEKYHETAIAIAAAKLLDLLIKHFGGG